MTSKIFLNSNYNYYQFTVTKDIIHYVQKVTPRSKFS
jgi:hypothetical protein